MYLIDTNIFLEVLLSGKRKDECELFLSLLRNEEKIGIVTDFSIHSILVVMEGLERRRELKLFLMSLLGYKGLRIYNTTLMDELSAINLSYDFNLDIDDSIQYHAATILKVDGIVSFDKHFDGLRISRLEPSQIV